MAVEIWKDIDDYEGIYQVSNFGRLKRLERNVVVNSSKAYIRHLKEMILSPTKDKDGYLIANLGKEKRRLGRVVAQAFIPNPNNYEQVNHINGIKEDNSANNLEWCTNIYNQEHAYRIGLKKTRLFAKIDKQSNKIVRIFKSLNDVILHTQNSDPSTIIKVCKGKRNEHCGYKWIYATADMKIGDVVCNI